MMAERRGAAGGSRGSSSRVSTVAALGHVPKLSHDVVTLEHAIAAEELIVATYRAAAAQLSTSGDGQRLGAVVTAIHGEHQAHLTRLRARLVLPPRLAHTKFLAGRPSPLPADSQGIIGALVADERAAAARLTSELLHAPPALAQLMASIAASEAAHVIYLRRAGSP